MAFNRSLIVIGVSVLACFLVPAPSLQMGNPASRGDEKLGAWLTAGELQPTYSVVFHAFGLLVMLSHHQSDSE
jgi:hypothetical protein